MYPRSPIFTWSPIQFVSSGSGDLWSKSSAGINATSFQLSNLPFLFVLLSFFWFYACLCIDLDYFPLCLLARNNETRSSSLRVQHWPVSETAVSRSTASTNQSTVCNQNWSCTTHRLLSHNFSTLLMAYFQSSTCVHSGSQVVSWRDIASTTIQVEFAMRILDFEYSLKSFTMYSVHDLY